MHLGVAVDQEQRALEAARGGTTKLQGELISAREDLLSERRVSITFRELGKNVKWAPPRG